MITKEELQERAQLVRIHEANCQIEHPTDQELAFRMATMKAIARCHDYPELRKMTLGPTPPTPAAKKS